MKTKFLAMMMVALMTFSGLAVMLTVDGNDADDVTPDPDAEAAPTYLYGYGSNTYGQLGQGNTTSVPASSPVQIGSEYGGVIDVATNTTVTLFVTSDYQLYAIGQGFGSIPIRIGESLGNISSVYAFKNVYFIATEDNRLYGWGPNINGWFGDTSSTVQYTSPVQIGTSLGSSIIDVLPVYYFDGQYMYICFCLYLTADNKLYGAGERQSGPSIPFGRTLTRIGATYGDIVMMDAIATNQTDCKIAFITSEGKLYYANYATTSGYTAVGADYGTISDMAIGFSELYFINSAGELYSWNGSTYTQIGADLGQIEKLNLNPVTASSATLYFINSAGELYSWNGSTYTQIGADVGTFSRFIGSDSNSQRSFTDKSIAVLTTDGRAYAMDMTQLFPGMGKVEDVALLGGTYAILDPSTDITITPIDADTYGGSVSADSLTDIPIGTEISVSGNTVTIGDAVITATLPDNTAQYTYGIVWSVEDGDTVTSDMIITATFTRTVNTYTVTIESNDTDKGTVSPVTLTDIPYGTSITVSGNTLTVGEQTITATPAEGMEVKWVPSSGTVTGDLTIKANFAEPTSPAQKLMSFIPLIVILAIIMLAATAIASFRGTGFDMVKLMIGLTVCILVLTFALLPAAGGL